MGRIIIDYAQRIYAEALRRLNDADFLAEQFINTQSDSDSILRILGFEILLKCAIFLTGQSPKPIHNYVKLWKALPGKVQQEIEKAAKDRMPGHTDLSDINKLLKSYQTVFEKGRYFYEFYKDYTLEEQKELGEYWIELGAPTEEADLQYYPNELECLIHGLKLYIEPKLHVE